MNTATVDSFIEFWKEIRALASTLEAEKKLLFRGHGDCKYKLQPGLFREDEKDREYRVYKEIVIEKPEEFTHSHVSNLAKMQHFGSKTRLLDFSLNPLVSLYFACQKKDKVGQVIVFKEKSEEILHHTSDKALMLTCLPYFKDKEQEELKNCFKKYQGKIPQAEYKQNKSLHRFLHEIRHECPAFEKEIIGRDLLNNYFMRTYKEQERIKAQDGLFMIFGLEQKDAEQDKRMVKRINISKDKKQEILKDLKLMGISESTIYPQLV